jgi:uncharacterized membrane protein YccC
MLTTKREHVMQAKNIVWNSRDALFGLALAVPGAVVILSGNVKPGIALLVGVLAAAGVEVPPTRKRRISIFIIGLLFAVSIVLGAFLAQWPVVAVAGIALVAFGAAQLAARKPLGVLVMSLALPLMGIGFSYDLQGAASFGVLVIVGSLYAWLVSLLFREYSPPPAPAKPLMSKAQAWLYGILLALTAATTATLGFATHVEHVGWIVGAALLVMRPSQEMQELRSVGRLVAVLLGAFSASVLLAVGVPTWVIAVVAPAAIVCMAATHTSRWYITAAFTTFLVFWMLLYQQIGSGHIVYRFFERVLETVAGVAIAYFFGLLVPKVLASVSRREAPQH